MSKGGSTSSSIQIPEYVESAAKESLDRGRRVQQIGYTPYYGPDVAAFTPAQMQSMRTTGGSAEAFGFTPASDYYSSIAGMPSPQQFAGGLMGYSSAPLFEESVETLRQKRPAQVAAMESMFIDPITGDSPSMYEPVYDVIEQPPVAGTAPSPATLAPTISPEMGFSPTVSDSLTALPSQYIDPISGEMSDVRMMSPSTPYLGPTPSLTPSLDAMYDNFDSDAFDPFDYGQDIPFKYYPDVGAKMDANGQYELEKYAPDRDFTYRETPFSDIQFQEDAPPLFDLEGNPIESMIRQPTIPDLRFGSPSTPVLDPITELVTQPVADIASQPIVDLAPKPRERSFVDVMADQGPTGTYNQKYWAEKLRSGSTQAELKAEQDAIAAAGGKVYLGSTPTSPMVGGTPSQDSMLGDVLNSGAGLLLNGGLLGATAKKLTGNYPFENTPEEIAAIPVVDISDVEYKATPKKTKKKSKDQAESIARAKAAAKKRSNKLATNPFLAQRQTARLGK